MSKKKSLLTLALLVCHWATISFADNAHANSDILTFSDARHLLNRTGFGASPVEISAVIGLSRRQAVEHVISGLSEHPQSTLPDWTGNAAPNHWRRPHLSTKEQRKFREIRNAEIQTLRHWWVNEMISTSSPQTERLTLFWHNHFATAYSGINSQAVSIFRQHMMLREHSTGNFRTMLKSVIRDPAMLNYLDNNASFKGNPNENFAREIMELFTLGEGNYSEQDIKNAARALTGYGYSQLYDQRFVFKEWNHDKRDKTIFGQSGNFDGDDLVDLILQQPAAARFITGKLWRVFIGDVDNNSDKLTTVANTFRQSDYDLKTLYRSLLTSEDFWHSDNRAGVVQSPVSLTVGAIRTTGILPANWQTLPGRQADMGQHLFEPPNVAGWSGGETWISPGRLLTRLDWLAEFADNPADTTEPDLRAANDSRISMNSGSNNELIARLASEEFDGPVKYKITLHTKKGKVWDSGAKELKGGHDTLRMGRIRKQQMPWQQISFPVDVDHKSVRKVEVVFLNDAANKATGADRNLYVSSISLGNSVWLPADGKQISKCAPKRPQLQGNLKCGGKLRIKKRTRLTGKESTPVPDGTLRTSGAYLKSATNPEHKRKAELAFNLADVEFKGRYWNTLTVTYTANADGYALRMNSLDCWPDCFTQWPQCAQTSDQPAAGNTVSLALASESELQQCMHNELPQPDKELAGALWMLVDDFYAATAKSRKLRRANLAKQYDLWGTHVATMSEQLAVSRYASNETALQIEPRELQNSTSGEHLRPPLPAGITAAERASAWRQLRQAEPQINLASLLLPLNTQTAKATSLHEILADLTYQLK